MQKLGSSGQIEDIYLVKVRIAASGQVQSVGIEDLPQVKVAKCLKQAFGGMQFPESDADFEITVPLKVR